MAGRPSYDWPSPEEVQRVLDDAGTEVAAAERLNVTREAFQHFRRKHKLTLPGPRRKVVDAGPGEVEVMDPVRVKADQDKAVIKALRKENEEYRKALASQEEFFQRLVDVTKLPVRPLKVRVAKQEERKPARSVIAPIFDQQFGQFVRPSDTPGDRGGFSVSVFDKRLRRWVDGLTGILAHYATSYRIEELIIPFGGDNVEGDEIFPGQAWQLELNPPEQVWDLAGKMDQALRTVVAHAREELGVKRIALYGVDDNHGKVGGKKAGARPATYSWNWLYQKILFDLHLRGVPIDEKVIEPGGALFFYGAGHQFQLIHGHQIRGWGGLPFYGLTRFDGRSIRLHNTIYRYLLMGHHHQPAEIPNGAGETIVSGDWVGANNLSGMMTAVSRPQQRVLFVAKKWGVTGGERIYFQEADEAYAQPYVYGQAA
ncbi:MAG: hypothetical protein M3355_11820 [Actinomycetota bacterium]|nr:hypothetical protein [Actinomycetota bacterium]